MEKSGQVNWLKALQFVVLLSVLLYFGRPLFVPLSFALLISFVLYPICNWLENRKWPRWAAILLCLLLLLVVVGLPVYLLIKQVGRFTAEWPLLQQKLVQAWQNLSEQLSDSLGMNTARQLEWTEKITADLAAFALGLVQSLLFTSAVSLILLVLIPIYVFLILYNREQLARAVYAFFPASEHKKVQQVLHETITTYYNFIKGMFIVYLVVAILNSIGLLLLGIPHAIFFGIIASILTFIPYVGITIGAILPMAVAWTTYDSVWYPVGVVLVFTVVQYLEANLIFPWAVSYRLQVNMLFTLLAIVAGGILWGASGMILFVPFLAIFKLIADKYDSMHPVALLLDNK